MHIHCATRGCARGLALYSDDCRLVSGFVATLFAKPLRYTFTAILLHWLRTHIGLRNAARASFHKAPKTLAASGNDLKLPPREKGGTNENSNSTYYELLLLYLVAHVDAATVSLCNCGTGTNSNSNNNTRPSSRVDYLILITGLGVALALRRYTTCTTNV